jgi:predicted transcriptional regulator
MPSSPMGELERAVMTVLWDHPDGLSAQEIRAALRRPEYAVTTVLTVLTRLTRKGFVARNEDQRPHRYRPTRSREEFLSELMADALGAAPNADDRAAVLARFVGSMGADDAEHLRSLVRKRRKD